MKANSSKTVFRNLKTYKGKNEHTLAKSFSASVPLLRRLCPVHETKHTYMLRVYRRSQVQPLVSPAKISTDAIKDLTQRASQNNMDQWFDFTSGNLICLYKHQLYFRLFMLYWACPQINMNTHPMHGSFLFSMKLTPRSVCTRFSLSIVMPF